jgi:hypothetical protein
MACLFKMKHGNHKDNFDIIKSKIPDLIDLVLSHKEPLIPYDLMNKYFTSWINDDVRWGAEFTYEFTTPLVIGFLVLNKTIYNIENKKEIMQQYLENLLITIISEDYDY